MTTTTYFYNNEMNKTIHEWNAELDSTFPSIPSLTFAFKKSVSPTKVPHHSPTTETKSASSKEKCTKCGGFLTGTTKDSWFLDRCNCRAVTIYKPCRFFSSPEGCNKGPNCDYLHVRPNHSGKETRSRSKSPVRRSSPTVSDKDKVNESIKTINDSLESIIAAYNNQISGIYTKYKLEAIKNKEVSLRFFLYVINTHISDRLDIGKSFQFNTAFNSGKLHYESLEKFYEQNPVITKAISIIKESLKNNWDVVCGLVDNNILLTFIPHIVNPNLITSLGQQIKKPLPVFTPKLTIKQIPSANIPKTPPQEPTQLIPPMAPRKKFILKRFNQDVRNVDRRSLSPKRLDF
jgi:hypothetical protein